MQTFINKVQDFILKMKKRYWDFHGKLEQKKNYVTSLFFDLVFNKKRKQKRNKTHAPMKKGLNTWKGNSQQHLILS